MKIIADTDDTDFQNLTFDAEVKRANQFCLWSTYEDKKNLRKLGKVKKNGIFIDNHLQK